MGPGMFDGIGSILLLGYIFLWVLFITVPSAIIGTLWWLFSARLELLAPYTVYAYIVPGVCILVFAVGIHLYYLVKK